MWKPRLIVATLSGGFSIVLIISALATNHWMTACMDAKDLVEKLKFTDETSEVEIPHMQVCCHIGLFQTTSFSATIAIEEPLKPNKATAGFLISALIFIAIAFAFSNFDKTSKLSVVSLQRLRIAEFSLLCVGVLFSFVAALVFTLAQKDAIKNPNKFFNDFLIPAFPAISSARTGNDLGFLSLIGDVIGTVMEWTGWDWINELLCSDSSGITDILSSFKDLFLSSVPHESEKSALHKLSSAASVYFDHSFYLAWFAFIFGVISATFITLYQIFEKNKQNCSPNTQHLSSDTKPPTVIRRLSNQRLDKFMQKS